MNSTRLIKYLGIFLVLGVFIWWWTLPYGGAVDNATTDVYFMYVILAGILLWGYADFKDGLLNMGRSLDGAGTILASAFIIGILAYFYHFGPLLSQSTGTGWANLAVLIIALFASGIWLLEERSKRGI